MAEYIDRTKLLTEISNGIKAGNYEEGYEEYTNINDMDDIIETIKYSDKADVIERSKIDKAIAEIEDLNLSWVASHYEDRFYGFQQEVLEILKRNIGE